MNAQSVGGGGGAAGSVTNSASASGDASVAGSATLSFGGSGGDGGSAGDVTFAVPDSLTIRTGNLDTGAGSGSHGIFLNPSVVVVVKVDPSSPAMSPPPRPTLTSALAICCCGGSGGGGGDGLVSLAPPQIADLDIATVGDTAHGVFLQSIGGVAVVVPSSGAQVVISPPISAPLAVTAVQQETFNSLLTGNSPPLRWLPRRLPPVRWRRRWLRRFRHLRCILRRQC